MFLKNSIVRILIFTLIPQTVETGKPSRLYVWNVGQGQWLTWVRDQSCFHFDMGGERAPLAKIRQLCALKTNSLYLSHADWDHIKFMPWGSLQLPGLCLMNWPREKLEPRKEKRLKSIPKCSTRAPREVEELPTHPSPDTPPDLARSQTTTNDLSRVYLIHSRQGSVLIPGDSTQMAERFWSEKIPSQIKIRTLVLGHHGSRTSTGEFLLQRLPFLRLTIASARKRRYGHPHSETLQLTSEHGAPTLRTEQWGNLVLEL